MKITYFVHSITKDNEKGLATGWLSGELSPEGIKRAHNVNKLVKDLHFDAVFSSDLQRAVHSTQLFFDNRFPVFLDWRLRECNYGDLDGKPAVDFKKNREAEYVDTPYPGGESYKDVEARLRSFLTDASRLFPDGHIAIVAHQAPQLALEVIANRKTWQQAIADDWRKTGDWQPGWQYVV